VHEGSDPPLPGLHRPRWVWPRSQLLSHWFPDRLVPRSLGARELKVDTGTRQLRQLRQLDSTIGRAQLTPDPSRHLTAPVEVVRSVDGLRSGAKDSGSRP